MSQKPTPSGFQTLYAWLTLGIFLLIPSMAWAAENGGGGDLKNVLYLIGVIAIAYLGAHVFAEILEKRFGIVTGVEYILIGMLIGPWSPILKMLNFTLIDHDLLTQLSPFLVLGTGAIGLLAGLRSDFMAFNAKTKLLKALMINATTVILIAAPLSLLAFWLMPSSRYPGVTPLILCTAAIALVADTAPIRSLISYLNAKGEAGTYGSSMARLTSSLAVIFFGSIFCIFHEPGIFGDATPNDFYIDWLATTEWLLVHLILGIVLGGIFSLFLVRDYEDGKILTVILGIVIFTSGLAFYLKLSPIFVNFILGVVLRLFSKQANHVQAMLLSVERPLYITLFFFAGAMLTFQAQWWAYALIPLYLVLRGLGRMVGGIIAFRFQAEDTSYPPLGAILWAPGGLSIAMLLNIKDVFGDYALIHELYVAILGGIVISEIIAYKNTRRWLIDSTDVDLVQNKDSIESSTVASQGSAS